MTQLEKAKNKLNRLKVEEKELMKAIRKEHDSIPFGQPNIIGRRDIYKDVKRYRAKSIANIYEQDKQEKRIEMLEEMKAKDESKVLSEHAKNLIDSGLVTQWQNKPIYYFVKGLRKVAFELNDLGDFEISKHYPAYRDSDIEFVEKLLKK